MASLVKGKKKYKLIFIFFFFTGKEASCSRAQEKTATKNPAESVLQISDFVIHISTGM